MEVDLGVLYYYDYKVIHVYHCILRLRLQNEGGLAVWDYSAGKGMYFRRSCYYTTDISIFSLQVPLLPLYSNCSDR